MIHLNSVSKVYKTPEVTTNALSGIDLIIEEGEFISLTGPSGSGKTTLLNVLGLLDSVSEGEYFFFEQDITNFSERKKTKLRKKNIGFVFQNFNLIDELSIFENIEMPLLYTSLSKKERKEKVLSKISFLGLDKIKKKYPQQLSGGEQQRVAVARALVNEPKFIIADEPTGNLDSKNAEFVMKLLKSLHKSGSGVIMVTHDLNLALHADRIIKLKDGHIIE